MLTEKHKKDIQYIFNEHSANAAKEHSIYRMTLMEDEETVIQEIKDYWEALKPKKFKQWAHPDLRLDNKGHIMITSDNLFTILTEHPFFKGKLAYNELNYNIYYDKNPIADVDYIQLRLDLCRELHKNFSVKDIADMSELVARANHYHPIKTYLNSISWDKKDRIETFCAAMQIAPTNLNITVLTKFLIASVARVYQPGCKVDSVPVFQGKTGIRKSTAFKTLMHDQEWFTDEPVDFGTKDSKQLLIGKWFVELSELSTVNSKDNNLIKSNITQTVDEFRPPYDRNVKKFPRQFVYIGTTNDTEFMYDPTSNRRFWVLQIEGLIDTDILASIRDQLWAQAVHLYQTGERWYLDKEQEHEMSEFVSNFEQKDAWHDTIVAHLNDINAEYVSTKELLDFLKPNYANQDNRDRYRVQKVMQFLKWRNINKRFGKDIKKVWQRPTKIVGEDLPVEIQGWN